MDGSLEEELLAFVNGADAPLQIVERFQADGQSLVEPDLAQHILAARSGLPSQSFGSLNEIESVEGMPSGLLPQLLEVFPLQMGWRLNDRPVLMFPVRLETRFKEGELLIRIYPDQVLVDAHDPRLTPAELEAGRIYYENAFGPSASDTSADPRRDAWRVLVRTVGAERAAWVHRMFEEHGSPDEIPVKDEQEGWFVPPQLMALPDRFEVLAYRGEDLVGRVVGAPIHGTYAMLARSTSTSGFFDAESKWVSDFEEAESRGMAVRITPSQLTDDLPLDDGFSKIVAVGVRSGSPDAGRQWLEQAIERHHYVDGVAFLEHGTPTNNTETTQSAHSESTEDIEGSFDTEIIGAPSWEEPDADSTPDAERLGVALGLGSRPQAFRHLANADNATDSRAEAMQAALWPVTGDYFLRQLLPDLIDPEGLSSLAGHFVRHVRAGGCLPAVRVGTQPYGVLPVTSTRAASEDHPHGWAASPMDGDGEASESAFDAALHTILMNLYAQWREWADDPKRVPRINGSEDPDEELLKILAMEPTSVAYRTRPFMTEKFAGWLLAALRNDAFVDLVDHVPERYRNRTNDENDENDESHENDERAQIYLIQKWSESWDQQNQEWDQRWCELTGAPEGRFRSSHLMKLLGWWKDDELDLELVRHVTEDVEETPRSYLPALSESGQGNTDDPKTLLQELLIRSVQLSSGSPAHEEVRSAIGRLADLGTTAEIERLFRQTLDLCTHRLDAWLSSLATKRLAAMRSAQPEGVHLGAYGYVEDLRPDLDGKQSDGYLHAPSSTQSKAAAVLYNAFRVRSGGELGSSASPFRMNLGSESVRRALHIIDGVRQGQPLGALLGYQFERALHERALDQYIDEFRDAFPIAVRVAPGQVDGVSSEALAARNVVDGLALVRWWEDPERSDIVSAPGSAREIVGAMLQGYSIPGLNAEVEGLQASLDAVADLLIYEAVAQTAAGNYERASTALDALSAGGFPPEIESIGIPTSGKDLGHRVCLVVPDTDVEPDGPRAIGEPRIAGWLRTLLGEPATIAAQFEITRERPEVNVLTEEELKELPGISSDTAERLVHFRSTVGPFQALAELGRLWATSAGDQEEEDRVSQLGLLQRWVRTGLDSAEPRYFEPIDVNRATTTELTLLPGVGEPIARDIVAKRPFAALDDLLRVDEIGPELLARIEPWIVTGVVTLHELGLGAADVLYASAALPESVDDLDLAATSRVDDPLVYQSRRININTASQEELAALPGVSSGMASQIDEYRVAFGPLQSLDDLHEIWPDGDDGEGRDPAHLVGRWVLTGNGLHEEQFYRRININLDPVEELMLLEGMSRGAANRIIDERPYDNADELLAIPGFSATDLSRALPWITFVRDETPSFEIISGRSHAADTEIELRIKHFVRSEYQLGVDHAIDVDLWGSAHHPHGMAGALQLARTIYSTLSQGVPLRPDSLDLPSADSQSTFGDGDVAELEARVDGVLQDLCRSIVSLGGDPLLGLDGEPLCPPGTPPVEGEPESAQLVIESLLAASRYGIDGIIPEGPGDPELASKQGKALTELSRRASAAMAELAGAASADDAGGAVSALVGVMKAVFGRSFLVWPTFTTVQAAELASAFSQDHFQSSRRQDRLRLWLQQAAVAHPRVTGIEDVMMTGQLWRQPTHDAAEPTLSLHVAQLPFAEGNEWLGLDDDERTEQINADVRSGRGQLSVVAAVAGSHPLSDPPESTRLAGILVDEWTELIPARTVDTNVSFHYEAPSSQAPQCLLLAVPGQRSETPRPWEALELVEIVKDTIDLAKIRAVDADAMAELEDDTPGLDEEGLGLVFPALMFPVDRNDPSWTTGEFAETINDWVQTLETTDDVCATGSLVPAAEGTGSDDPAVYAVFESTEQDTWLLATSEAPSPHQYARGITSPLLGGATIEVRGIGTTVTNRLFVRDYRVSQYPAGLTDQIVEGTLSTAEEGGVPQLILTSDEGPHVLQGGAVYEVEQLVPRRVRVTGHGGVDGDAVSLWVDTYEIVPTAATGPAHTAVGVSYVDEGGIYLIDGDGHKWYLDGDYDAALMQVGLGGAVWVDGVAGHRGDDVDPGPDNITVTDLGLVETFEIGMLFRDEGGGLRLAGAGDQSWLLDSSTTVEVDDMLPYENSKIWVAGSVGNRVDDQGAVGSSNIRVTSFGVLRPRETIIDCPGHG